MFRAQRTPRDKDNAGATEGHGVWPYRVVTILEPAALPFFAFGLAGLGFLARRWKREYQLQPIQLVQTFAGRHPRQTEIGKLSRPSNHETEKLK